MKLPDAYKLSRSNKNDSRAKWAIGIRLRALKFGGPRWQDGSGLQTHLANIEAAHGSPIDRSNPIV
jgi:hypothetical protein